ncbi:MAG: hypothetical protein RL204_2 [Bacteroidota bacterium]
MKKYSFLILIMILGISTCAFAQDGDSLVHDCWEPYFLYDGEKVVGRVTANRYWTMSMEMPVENTKAYSVERGTFKNYKLWNGSVEYIADNGTLIKKATIKNGVGNEKVIAFSDSAFRVQVHTHIPRIDLNDNGKIEEGEMLTVQYLKISSMGMKKTDDIFKFTALETLIIDKQYFKGSDLLDKAKIEERFRNVLESNESIPPYDFVETEAEFPGGQERFFYFINDNVSPPDSSANQAIGGDIKVYVQFIVEMDGTLSNIQVLRTNSDTMGKAVVAALKKSPKWTPGTISGKSVRQRMILPVVFTLQ